MAAAELEIRADQVTLTEAQRRRAPYRRIVWLSEQRNTYRAGRASLLQVRYRLECQHVTETRVIFPGTPQRKYAQCYACARNKVIAQRQRAAAA